jgi:hypothetical protein
VLESPGLCHEDTISLPTTQDFVWDPPNPGGVRSAPSPFKEGFFGPKEQGPQNDMGDSLCVILRSPLFLLADDEGSPQFAGSHPAKSHFLQQKGGIEKC